LRCERMLSLFAAPIGLEVNIVGGAMNGPAVLQQPSPPFVLQGMGSLVGMLQQFNRQSAAYMQRAPVNPCLEDMRRLKCADSACLKRAAEDLAPTCAAFLLGAPIPSPAPEARDISSVMAELSRGPTPTVMRTPTSDPTGFFSVMTTDSNGEVHRASGPIGGGRGGMMTPMMPSTLSSFFPPELFELLRGGGLEIEMEEEEEETLDNEDPPTHPCAREIGACTRETGSSAREGLEQCLVRHFTQLSTECKCFVHHVVGSKPPTVAAAVAAPPAIPHVVVVGKPLPAHGSVTVGVVRASQAELHPLHRLSCLFLFSAILLVSIMLGRACVLACFPSRREQRRRVVLVPPEHAVIRAVGHPEAKIVDAKKSPEQMATEVEVQSMQVAEPLVKA